MIRIVTVHGKHVEIRLEQHSARNWTATAVNLGEELIIIGPTANRAASDWAVAASIPQMGNLPRPLR